MLVTKTPFPRVKFNPMTREKADPEPKEKDPDKEADPAVEEAAEAASEEDLEAETEIEASVEDSVVEEEATEVADLDNMTMIMTEDHQEETMMKVKTTRTDLPEEEVLEEVTERAVIDPTEKVVTDHSEKEKVVTDLSDKEKVVTDPTEEKEEVDTVKVVKELKDHIELKELMVKIDLTVPVADKEAKERVVKDLSEKVETDLIEIEEIETSMKKDPSEVEEEAVVASEGVPEVVPEAEVTDKEKNIDLFHSHSLNINFFIKMQTYIQISLS